MAKIVSDSLIPSKKNAPLDERTEVNTMADIASIQNPCDSLEIYVKETGRKYKISSFKEEVITGTTITKRVIDKVEPVGDVSYTEVGDINLDGVFDQEGVETMDVGDAPLVDFDSLL